MFLLNRKSDIISHSKASFSHCLTVTALISDFNQLPATVVLELLLLNYANPRCSYALIVKDERLAWLSLFD